MVKIKLPKIGGIVSLYFYYIVKDIAIFMRSYEIHTSINNAISTNLGYEYRLNEFDQVRYAIYMLIYLICIIVYLIIRRKKS